MQRSTKEHNNHLPRNLNHLPEYAQKYPSLVKYHLCDVKRSICYPNPPTLRNIDRDEVLHKLSDEHCRHTTYCGPECFDAAPEKYEDTNNTKRDFCLDKLLEKYPLDSGSIKNEHFEILQVCPSERRQFEQMCSQHKDKDAMHELLFQCTLELEEHTVIAKRLKIYSCAED